MARVAKVVKGGRRFSFSALTVVGDSDSYVGLGFGKAKEIPEAVRKSIEDGKKNLIKVEKQNNTIPHKVNGKFKSARVLLKPGAPGTGIIAGEAVRAVVELGGIQDILTKRFGSSNKLNIVKATIDALKQLDSPNRAKQRRGISLSELFGPYSKKRRDEKLAELKLKKVSTTAEPEISQPTPPKSTAKKEKLKTDAPQITEKTDAKATSKTVPKEQKTPEEGSIAVGEKVKAKEEVKIEEKPK